MRFPRGGRLPRRRRAKARAPVGPWPGRSCEPSCPPCPLAVLPSEAPQSRGPPPGAIRLRRPSSATRFFLWRRCSRATAASRRRKGRGQQAREERACLRGPASGTGRPPASEEQRLVARLRRWQMRRRRVRRHRARQ
jgi:hypothetical protein